MTFFESDHATIIENCANTDRVVIYTLRYRIWKKYYTPEPQRFYVRKVQKDDPTCSSFSWEGDIEQFIVRDKNGHIVDHMPIDEIHSLLDRFTKLAAFC